MTMKVVVFLQNAWSPLYAGGTWPRRSWLRALHNSRSGTRLKVMTKNAPNAEFWYDNTTPLVGDSPSSIIEADESHIKSVLDMQKPDAVILCGKQADKAVSSFLGDMPVLVIPHPAFRVVTNDLFVSAGKMLNDGFSGRVEIRQARGGIVLVS